MPMVMSELKSYGMTGIAARPLPLDFPPFLLLTNLT